MKEDLNANQRSDSIHHAEEGLLHSGGNAGNKEPLVYTIRDHLMVGARDRTIHRAVAGGRFCAVMLDDGSVGVANLCPDVCGQPSRHVSDGLPQPGTFAEDALATLSSEKRSAIGLATANALANSSVTGSRSSVQAGVHHGEREGATSIEGDLLDALELRPDDDVGMVGCFSPLVEPIRRRVRKLSIFERGCRLMPDLLPEDRAPEVLPKCSVAIITATTLINGTIDNLLAASANCREVVLLGPSTPLVPEVCARSACHVTLLAGVVVIDAEQLLRTVEQNGGTRDFKTSVIKVNVRVGAVGENPY